MAEQVKETHQRPGPDDKQKAAILCLDNAVVSAGAGSGKTFVLTERFFRLVESGKAEVDEILTLTFTKKAASEMFERIYLRLLRSREGSELLREQVRKFDQAQISTLDSFCAQIARAGAGLFGMSPDFSIDDSGAADCAEQTALKYLLRRSNNPVLQEYIVNYSFERVWKHFFAVYGYKYISVALKTDYGEMEKKQKLYLETQFQHHANKMLSAGRYILSLDENAGKAVLTNQKALSCFPELSDAVAAKNFKTVLALCDSIALSKAGVSQSKKQELADLGNYIDEFREQQKNVNIIADTLTSWDINREVFNLLQEYEQELRDEKRRLGLCSYYDVLSLATETLKKDKALREYFKSVFRYIMIDEFQDNNGMQKQLLYLLAEKKGLFNEKPSAEDLEEGKLFFVGDDKQSIYRFRGADVSVFKALRNELAGNAGSHIEMEKKLPEQSGID